MTRPTVTFDTSTILTLLEDVVLSFGRMRHEMDILRGHIQLLIATIEYIKLEQSHDNPTE